jgi:hypothetical protein
MEYTDWERGHDDRASAQMTKEGDRYNAAAA